MAKKSCDTIITTVPADAPVFNEYQLKPYFEKIATLIPDKTTESLKVKESSMKYNSIKGIVYCFVVDGKILKLGKTDTTMKDRVQSYNCGKRAYRERGTCSVTNYAVLQSFLAINSPIEVWGYAVPPAHFTLFGEEVTITTSPSKHTEKVFQKITQQQFGDKLLLCIQD